MASEHPGETSVSLTLPDSLSEWLDDVADEEDLSREDVLLQLLSAYRRVEGEGAPDGEGALDDGELTVRPTDGPADELVTELRSDIESMVERELAEYEAEGVTETEVESRVESVLEDEGVEALLDEETLEARIEEAIESRVDELVDAVLDSETFQSRVEEVATDAVAENLVEEEQLDERVGDVESQFMELLDDVRERVVQVKREADAKAPADHDHPELDDQVAALADDLDDVSTTVEDLADRMDAGFDNFEEVLSYLTDSIDELSARQTTLARAVVESREELQKLAANEAARTAADELRTTANQHGVTSAVCEECEAEVKLGLLSRAQCPHCSATFTGLDPASGFFGSNRLETGDRPALEPGDVADEGFEFGVQEIIDSESPAPDAETRDEPEEER